MKDIREEIERLEDRKKMAAFQRKITTQLSTVIEYDQEIARIDRRLEVLYFKIKPKKYLLARTPRTT